MAAERGEPVPGERREAVTITDLSVSYPTDEGELPAVRHVTLSIARGETVGLVGESGSGKTTLALGAIGYLPGNGVIKGGGAHIAGIDVRSLDARGLRRFWGSKVGMVSQDPRGALNPSMTLGRQLDEMGRRHLALDRSAARRLSLEMLDRVQMPRPETVVDRYPHQLSGGMLQRGAIAMALITRPDFLILDEPTTALDVTTQAAVLDLLTDLKEQFGSAILYITHNLGVVARICDRVAVMYSGALLEQAEVSSLFARPLHPYTANLLDCVPSLSLGSGRPGPPGGARPDDELAPAGFAGVPAARLATIPGSLPRLDRLPQGCIFAPRCPLALDLCRQARPPLVEAMPDHRTACLRWEVLLTESGREAALHVETELRHSALQGPPPDTEWAARERPPAPNVAERAPLLLVEGARKVFSRGRRPGNAAVDGATLGVANRQTYGLVGESGSGKTTLARVVAGLTIPSAGHVHLEGQTLGPGVDARPRTLLRRLQMVFQSPEASLNPRRTVGEALERPLRLLGGCDRKVAAAKARRLLEAVRLPASYLTRYPGELSGGEKQRVAIARAFAAGPDLVICDEPLSSLDVSVQGALMNLLVDLQEEEGTSYLFISHDLAAVQHLSHLIGVMYMGRFMEQGTADSVLAPPYHPYTETLVAAVPVPDPTLAPPRLQLRQNGSHDRGVPSGCRFHPRCPRFLGQVCVEEEPPWRLGDGQVIPAWTAAADSIAAAADHAIYCHIPLEELSSMQERSDAVGGGIIGQGDAVSESGGGGAIPGERP